MSISRVEAISNSVHYKSPKWLKKPKNIHYITLSKDSLSQEVDLFLIGLFGYNNIDFSKNPKQGFRNLIYKLDENGLLLGGGLLFYDDQRKIFPSCCCGLESWGEIVQDILDKKSPWLGHDPYPVIEYSKQNTIVWSDDCLGIYGDKKTKQELFSIEFDTDDLIRKSLDIEKKLSEFFTIPFQNRINELDPGQSNELTEKLLSWLAIRV